MKAQPLIIDAIPSDISVLASGLELRNKAAVEKGLVHNRSLREQRKAEAGKVLRREAEVAAEIIVRSRHKTTRSDEVARHYFGN